MSALNTITDADLATLRARLAAAEKRAEEAEATITEFRKEHAMWAEVNRGSLAKKDELIGELRCDLHLLETERGDEVARGLEAEDKHRATLTRLAAAEAVIAALPRCERCELHAMNECEYSGRVTMRCDAHLCSPVPLHPYAAPLRAYLALVEAQR